MFGRLKRKPEEDEAPLVPHGFLWQATDAPGNTDTEKVELAKPATFEDNQSTSEEVAMPANATPQPERSSPRKLGAISPPLQWPSPNIQEIVRHPETRPLPHLAQVASEPQKQEPATVETPAANAIIGNVIPTPARPSVAAVAREQTKDWSRAFSANVRSARAFFGSFAKSVSSKMSRAIASFRTESNDLAKHINFKGRMVNARNAIGAKLGEVRQQLNPIGAAAAQKLAVWREAAVLRSRSGLHKSAERLRSIDFSWAPRSLRRTRNLKVTVRIPRRDTARITSAVSAMRAPWNQVRKSVDRDSRLWTSMAMAGLSALIALAVVSGLSRYQPGSSPGVVAAHSSDPATGAPHISQNSGEVGANKAALVPIAPTVRKLVASSTSQRPSPDVPKQSKATTEPTKRAALKSSSTATPKPVTQQKPKRAHYSEDDDYIAKDTYVVYGSNGKPLRR